MKYLAVARGGALGAILRYYLGGSVLSRAAAPFPTATFVINVTGSFLIGFFLTLAAERVNISPHMKLAFAVGFLRAYTTFPPFESQTARPARGRARATCRPTPSAAASRRPPTKPTPRSARALSETYATPRLIRESA